MIQCAIKLTMQFFRISGGSNISWACSHGSGKGQGKYMLINIIIIDYLSVGFI